MRTGPLPYYERFLILKELGKIAQSKFNENLIYGGRGYHLHGLRNSLKFEPDIQNFDNIYYIDTGNDERTKVAYYFEYGTGIYNIKNRKYIRPINKPYMVWKDKISNKLIFATKTRGVQPIFMMTKAVNYVRNNRTFLQRKIRLKLGI